MNDASLPQFNSRTDAHQQLATPEPQVEPGVEQLEPTMSKWDLSKRLMAENHLWTNLRRAAGNADEEIDEEFLSSLTPERVKDDLLKLGIESDHHSRAELYHARNEQHYFNMIGRIEERRDIAREVESRGWTGVGLELASYLTDPGAFAVDLATGVGSKGRLLKRFASAGSQSAAAEIAIQAVLASDGEAVNPSEVATGVAAAFILGGGLGGMFGKRGDTEKELLQRYRLIDGESKAEEAFDAPSGANDSAGAARSKVVFDDDNPLDRIRQDGADEVEYRETPGRGKAGRFKDSLVQFLRIDGSKGMERNAKENVAQHWLVKKLMPSFINRDKTEVNRLAAMEWADQYVREEESAFRHAWNDHFARWQESQFSLKGVKKFGFQTFRAGKSLNMREDFNNAVGEVMQLRIEAENAARAAERDMRFEALARGEDPADFVPPEVAEPDLSAYAEEVIAAAESSFAAYKRMGAELEARGIKRTVDVQASQAEAQRYYTERAELDEAESLQRYRDEVGDQAAEPDTPFVSGFRDKAAQAQIESLLPQRSLYMPRRLSSRRALQFLHDTGQSGKLLEDLFTQALIAGRKQTGLNVSKKVSRIVAKAYVSRLLRKGEGMGSDLDFRYLEEGDYDHILKLMQDAKVPANEIEDVRRVLQKGVKGNQSKKIDAENPARLKHRLALDTSTTIKYGHAGKEHSISVRDFFETNAEDLHFDYARWAGGEVGLSKVGLSSTKMREIIEQAGEEARQNATGDPTRFNAAQVEDLQYAFDRIMGRSVNEGFNSATVRASRALTGIGFVSRMGSAWWAAMSEAGTLMAANSGGRILTRMPAFRDIMKSMMDGTMEPAYLRQLTMWSGGMGDDLARGTYGAKHEASATAVRYGKHGSWDRRFAAGEDVLEGLKYGAAHANLLGYITDMTRKFSNVMALDTLDDIFVRGKEPPGWWHDRAKSWGLGVDETRLITSWLEGDGVKRGKLGEIVDLGEPPMEVKDALRGFLYRYTGEMIQHVNTGALPKWMHAHPVLRVLTQFRSFTTAAWTKHFLKDVHHADSLAAQKFLFTAGIAALNYGAITTINYGGTDEFEERMTMKNAMTYAFNYSVNASLLPALIDTVMEKTGGTPLFAMSRNSGLGQSLISTDTSSTPIGKLLDDAGTATSYLTSNVPRGNFQPTKSQLRALTNIMMIQTMWFMKPLNERAIEMFGSDEKVEKWNIWPDD